MPEQESDCNYRKTCHFYNMKNMTPANESLKELYCIEWPQKCAIYQAKANPETCFHHPMAYWEAAGMIV